MKTIITALIFIFLASNLPAQWYRTTSIYGYEFSSHFKIHNYKDIYFVSQLDSLIILKPDSIIKYDMDEITRKEIKNSYTFSGIALYENGLFFGSAYGLFRYDLSDYSWMFWDESNSGLKNNKIYSLTPTDSGLIITNERGSITTYRDGEFLEFWIGNQPEIVPSQATREFKFFNDKYIYLSMFANLCSFANDTIEIIKNYSPDFIDFPDEELAFGIEEHDGKLYFATTKNRFFCYDGVKVDSLPELNKAFEPYDSLRIFAFRFDKDENLVAHMQKFASNGFVEYNYLITVYENNNAELYDFIKDLDLKFPYFQLQKQVNGDLFMNSGVDFVSNGDPALSVETGRDLWLWNLYPNPVHDILNIEVYTTAAGSDNLEVNIYDIAGRHVLSKHPEADFNPMTGKSISSIELNELERGFYIFTITNGDWTKASTLIKR